MRITIDTSLDTDKDIKEAIIFLQNFISSKIKKDSEINYEGRGIDKNEDKLISSIEKKNKKIESNSKDIELKVY